MELLDPPEQVSDGLWRLERRAANGWSWNMAILALPSGGTLLYSPTWIGKGTFEAIETIGEPELLLAPNHFHHLHLPRFRERWPRARALASERAQRRLSGRGHRELAGLDVARLSSTARWLVPPGLRTGEAWLSVGPTNDRTWIVSDAFFHVNRRISGLVGLGLKALAVTPGLRVSRTYQWAAVENRRHYLDWLEALLREERPARLLCSHGDPLAVPDLFELLAKAARARLG